MTITTLLNLHALKTGSNLKKVPKVNIFKNDRPALITIEEINMSNVITKPTVMMTY